MPQKTYRGCVILRTEKFTTVPRGNRYRRWSGYARLYEIDGPVTKPYAIRPFLTSLADVKRYINEQLEAKAFAETQAPDTTVWPRTMWPQIRDWWGRSDGAACINPRARAAGWGVAFCECRACQTLRAISEGSQP